MAIEFQPWYKASERLIRCSGDDGCGALLMDGDLELHQQWHDKVWPYTMMTVVTAPASPIDVAEKVIEEIRVERKRPRRW